MAGVPLAVALVAAACSEPAEEHRNRAGVQDPIEITGWIRPHREVSPGSTDAQLAVNGILLVIVAVRFPNGVLGAGRPR